jgi:hypothetical protein
VKKHIFIKIEKVKPSEVKKIAFLLFQKKLKKSKSLNQILRNQGIISENEINAK